jgi:hypothetical protein
VNPVLGTSLNCAQMQLTTSKVNNTSETMDVDAGKAVVLYRPSTVSANVCTTPRQTNLVEQYNQSLTAQPGSVAIYQTPAVSATPCMVPQNAKNLVDQYNEYMNTTSRCLAVYKPTATVINSTIISVPQQTSKNLVEQYNQHMYTKAMTAKNNAPSTSMTSNLTPQYSVNSCGMPQNNQTQSITSHAPNFASITPFSNNVQNSNHSQGNSFSSSFFKNTPIFTQPLNTSNYTPTYNVVPNNPITNNYSTSTTNISSFGNKYTSVTSTSSSQFNGTSNFSTSSVRETNKVRLNNEQSNISITSFISNSGSSSTNINIKTHKNNYNDQKVINYSNNYNPVLQLNTPMQNFGSSYTQLPQMSPPLNNQSNNNTFGSNSSISHLTNPYGYNMQPELVSGSMSNQFSPGSNYKGNNWYNTPSLAQNSYSNNTMNPIIGSAVSHNPNFNSNSTLSQPRPFGSSGTSSFLTSGTNMNQTRLGNYANLTSQPLLQDFGANSGSLVSQTSRTSSSKFGNMLLNTQSNRTELDLPHATVVRNVSFSDAIFPKQPSANHF